MDYEDLGKRFLGFLGEKFGLVSDSDENAIENVGAVSKPIEPPSHIVPDQDSQKIPEDVAMNDDSSLQHSGEKSNAETKVETPVEPVEIDEHQKYYDRMPL